MLEFAATTFVTFLVILDPLGTVPIFLGLTADRPHAERQQAARRAIVTAAAVLIVFAVAGQPLLHLLGISLPAFRIAGGSLLFLLSIDMVFAHQSGIRSVTNVESKEAAERADVAIFPLAVPLIAGPGAITSVLLMMNEAHGSWDRQAVVLALMLIVLFISFLLLIMGSRLMERIGVTGVNVVGRVAGIILAALAVQFIVDGVKGVLL